MFQFLKFLYVSNESSFSRILPRTISHSIEAGLQAKTEDPLWFLTRQHQLGEFEADNGGQLISAEVSYQTIPLDKLLYENGGEDITDFSLPMESYLEDALGGTSWDSEHLEYKFTITNKGSAKLKADEYYSGNLEWHDFDIESVDFGGDMETIEVHPSKVKFSGMPNPRWWAFEDEKVDFGDIARPELNMLAMMLIEYALMYADDWYMIPMEQDVGTIRYISSIKAKDSFGIFRDIAPVKDESTDGSKWTIYTLSSDKPYFNCDSAVFLLPNTAIHSIDSEPVENVTLARDEGANLVWAVEHKCYNNGQIIARDDEEAAQESAKPKLTPGSIPIYQLKSDLRANWVPYLPRFINENGKLSLYLRRGRTNDKTTKQYKGTFLSESIVIFDEEIPKESIELIMKYKLITVGEEQWYLEEGPNGFYLKRVDEKKVYTWLGREKKPAVKQPLSRLKYDYLIEK